MTKDEALKLALDVLQEINKLSLPPHSIALPAEIDYAMDAIKEALAEGPSLVDQWAILGGADPLGLPGGERSAAVSAPPPGVDS